MSHPTVPVCSPVQSLWPRTDATVRSWDGRVWRVCTPSVKAQATVNVQGPSTATGERARGSQSWSGGGYACQVTDLRTPEAAILDGGRW
jgi:hypothetical protein